MKDEVMIDIPLWVHVDEVWTLFRFLNGGGWDAEYVNLYTSLPLPDEEDELQLVGLVQIKLSCRDYQLLKQNEWVLITYN